MDVTTGSASPVISPAPVRAWQCLAAPRCSRWGDSPCGADTWEVAPCRARALMATPPLRRQVRRRQFKTCSTTCRQPQAIPRHRSKTRDHQFGTDGKIPYVPVPALAGALLGHPHDGAGAAASLRTGWARRRRFPPRCGGLGLEVTSEALEVAPLSPLIGLSVARSTSSATSMVIAI